MAKTKADLRSDLMAEAKIKTAAVTNRVRAVQRKLQMTDADALYVVAAQADLNLAKYGLEPDELLRLNQHRAALEAGGSKPKIVSPTVRVKGNDAAATPASKFKDRDFHEIVVNRSRRAFTTGQHQDAVLRAFKSVNNRVKTLTGFSLDGEKLMSRAFKLDDPPLTLNALSSESEINEHEGTRFMMMGAARAMRNPRAHEDYWTRDEDEAFVLDALSFASLLHRLLDIAERRL